MVSDEHNPPGLEFLEAAVDLANSVEDQERDDIMIAAAIIYAALCLLDDALRTADEISDSYSRDTALNQIAVNAVACGPDTDVLSIVESIEDPVARNLALEQVSVKYAEHGRLEMALEVCGQLDDADSALSKIVPIIAEKDSFERGEELAREINDRRTRTVSFIALARVARRSAQAAQSTHSLLAAEAEAENQEDIEEQIYELIAIADVYKEIGDDQEVARLLTQAFKLCSKVEGSSHPLGKTFSKDQVLVEVAAGWARLGRYEQADLVTEEIDNPFEFGQASIWQAFEHHESGHDTRALELLGEADELITKEKFYTDSGMVVRNHSIHYLAHGYATVQRYDKALQAALLISDPEQQLIGLSDIGQEAARAGFTDSLYQIHDSVPRGPARVSYCLAVSDLFTRNNNNEAAGRLLLRSIDDAEEIQRTDAKSLMLIQIASRLLKIDMTAKAGETLLTVLNITAGIEDDGSKAKILLAMAELYHQHLRPLGSEEKEILETFPR